MEAAHGGASNRESLTKTMEAASLDEIGLRLRREVSGASATALADAGRLLWVGGTMFGSDRAEGRSPFEFGCDATVGLATVLQVAGELSAGAIALLEVDNRYAAAALVRQLVETEYLAWAFSEDQEEAADWLRASRDERQKFWRPARIRERAGDRFRGSDYWSHCSQGGHPSPEGMVLLPDHSRPDAAAPIWWCDLAMHVTSTWRYGVAGAGCLGHDDLLAPIAEESGVTDLEHQWREHDPLLRLGDALRKAQRRRDRPLPMAWIAD